MYIPISKDINKFFVNINGTNYPVNKMLLNTQEVTGVEVYADYYSQYFTIESLEDENVITFTKGSSASSKTYYANTGNGWTSYSTTASWTLNTGDAVMFKADATGGWNGWTFGSTKTIEVYGNIMSLLYEDDFEGEDTIVANNCFNRLFAYPNNVVGNGAKIVNAKNLKMPATNLTTSCYQGMFTRCVNLVTPPELPATTLGNQCYYDMFRGCTALVTAPALPATTLGVQCYTYIFRDCTALTNAPALPATTLAIQCYNSMFYGCTSLVTAPVLPATTLVDSCYGYMFYGCTGLTKAPDLPAATLASFCYRAMFNGCTALNEVVCLATDISASNCIANWLNNTAATGTLYKDSTMNDFVAGTNVPSGWTISNFN